MVDDEQSLLDGIRRGHRKSYEIKVACGARAGLDALEQDGPFAVVICDYQMPDMNGAEFLEQAQELSPSTVRLMLSGNADLDAAIEHARAHLAAQIESSGLVRYHGLPDGPTIGTLGCAITPDADDTALAWRIAGRSDDARRQPMLDMLAGYRDTRGFYRTWLAPKKQYRCLDPGSDPNPTDITIQMNVYLMLRAFDPPAAQALCTALQRGFRDEDVWVYYAKAPVLPYLRATELTQLGCPLVPPVERLALPAAGQAIWSEAAHALVEITASPGNADARQSARRVLAQLAADDFALLRRAPPLLYHNDLSATVRRYYWSEDVGYALWLRLYEAAGVDAEPQAQPAP